MNEFFKLMEGLSRESQMLTPEDVDPILGDPTHSLRLAVASAAGAQNRIAAGGGEPSAAEIGDASLCQRQAGIWLAIHERQIELEDRAESARSHAEFLKQQQNAPFKPSYGTKISDAFSQGTRPGGPKVPPVPQQDPVPVIPFVGPDASSGNEDKPVI